MTENKQLNIVLAGQANVGKSVIFNHFTGLHQHIGNWPGKTVEKAEGTLFYRGYTIDVVDLPGLYSLSPYSAEELISREYIALLGPDFIVNVVDVTNLERNLMFTLQLLELRKPMVLALNMMDVGRKKGIEIDVQLLEEILGIPVVETIASRRYGLTDILDRGIGLKQGGSSPKVLKYGREVEIRIEKLQEVITGIDLPYNHRWLAIKLLEKDEEVEKLIRKENAAVLEHAEKYCRELENIHGHDSSVVIADERCHMVSHMVEKMVRILKTKKVTQGEKLDRITTHRFWGYAVMTAIVALIFFLVLKFGNWFSSMMSGAFVDLQSGLEAMTGASFTVSLVLAAVESALALLEIVVPYILPFYLFLYILEDAGYLARVSFLTDNIMHRIGVHGKACIPLLLGFGCNVPACLACRIMETRRERLITGFLATMVPCSAVTVIIMGLVGRFVGVGWALSLYFFAAVVIFVVGWLASRILPGEPTELIMAMPEYKRPNFRTIAIQTWYRLKDFIFIAGPFVIVAGVIIEAAYLAGWLETVARFMSPVTVDWLGLPLMTGILLIFGILRKEMILVMLATLYGTTNFAQVMDPVQMLTLALVSMFYIPCVATIAALWKEFGWKKATGISLFEVIFAIGLAGVVSRLLYLFW